MESQLVWAPCPEQGYILGRILEIGADDMATIRLEPPGETKRKSHTQSEPIECSLQTVFPAEVDLAKNYDDNCSLMYLNEANLLHNLRLRYFENKIYTYVANILIALNPYQSLTEKLYSAPVMAAYRGKSLGKMPPHVFAIAEKAYTDMKRTSQSQSIIVSGESGAGKTESTKYVLRYLCETCSGPQAGGAIQIEQLILDANPLLEAFGNAKTARNNNSSRFGKFIEVYLDSRYMVAGGHISHYLLEKSRICGQISELERNYHIFYQLCVGLPEAGWMELKLGPPEKFNYLRNGCTRYFLHKQQVATLHRKRIVQLDGIEDPIVNDLEDFQSMDQALGHFGQSERQKRAIYRIVAAILHLGNISFEESTDDCKGGCRIKQNHESAEALENAASLLGVDREQLQMGLLSRVMQTNKGGHKGSIYMVPLKVHEAQNARDALAKAIYSRLFDYIVSVIINQALPLNQVNGLKRCESSQSIGVLDIAGFEYFQTNSFEQFCINYCNEKLQNFFNERILNAEQDLYEVEGLGIKRIDYMNNSDCIELFEARSKGIFHLLDEESRLPRPSPQHFTASVHTTHGGKFRIGIPRKSKLKSHRELRDDEGFLIRHFAGAVCYQTKMFIEKNNDTLHTNLEFLMLESSSPLMKCLFQPEVKSSPAKSMVIASTGGGGDKSVRLSAESVGGKFRKQLTKLIEKLDSTGTHFVRCIKPNFSMISKCFEGGGILSQLKCSGMTTVLRVMQHGYPSRATYAQIYHLYSPHLPPKLAGYEPRFFCKALVNSVGLSELTDVRLGVTKVFFRPGRFAEFDLLLKNDDPEALDRLVGKVQQWLVASRWKRAQWGVYSVIKLKSIIEYRRRCLIVIQANVRRFLIQARYRPHFESMNKIRQAREHLCQIEPLIGQIKSEEEKKVFDTQLQELKVKLDRKASESYLANSDPKILDKIKVQQLLEEIDSRIDSMISRLKSALSEQEQRLKRLQEEMEMQRKRKAEEELAKREAEVLRRKKAEEEAKCKREAERRAELESVYTEEPNSLSTFYSVEMLNAEERQRQVDYLNRLEQEKRDYELAIRMSAGDVGGVVQEEQQTVPKQEIQTPVGKKSNLTNWNYAKLRDTINESNDIELLEACREELHRRLKVYHQWKYRNNRMNSRQPAVEPVAGNENRVSNRAPESVIDGFYRALSNTFQSISQFTAHVSEQCKPLPQQRYFCLPLKSKGLWYAHFDGKWIVRQMELHPDKDPIMLVSGRDDLQMCELSLEETGLLRRRGAEIPAATFEAEWIRNGGQPYSLN